MPACDDEGGATSLGVCDMFVTFSQVTDIPMSNMCGLEEDLIVYAHAITRRHPPKESEHESEAGHGGGVEPPSDVTSEGA